MCLARTMKVSLVQKFTFTWSWTANTADGGAQNNRDAVDEVQWPVWMYLWKELRVFRLMQVRWSTAGVLSGFAVHNRRIDATVRKKTRVNAKSSSLIGGI